MLMNEIRTISVSLIYLKIKQNECFKWSYVNVLYKNT